ncbi:MAG TPA: YHYH protein [Acidobacteria bacterium]|nr:YHYH protein [Acidobacteriota bacterium]
MVTGSAATATTEAGATSRYLGSYTLTDAEFGTEVTTTVEDGVRTIVCNALPDTETGEFPNDGNPNTITEQDNTYTFSAEPTYVGAVTSARTTGVAINGVKFEPGTAETITCDSGQVYRVEAIQGMYDLGLDFNNAHVQPTGEYHYHGVSELMVDVFDEGEDLVHVGFAADGFLMYYSTSGAYRSGYALSTEPRTGTGCVASSALGGGAVDDLEGTTPDGTFASDLNARWTARPAQNPGAGAVVQALGVDGIRIGPQIDPGVPWTTTIGQPQLALALKSGNFGVEDFFLKALDCAP